MRPESLSTAILPECFVSHAPSACHGFGKMPFFPWCWSCSRQRTLLPRTPRSSDPLGRHRAWPSSRPRSRGSLTELAASRFDRGRGSWWPHWHAVPSPSAIHRCETHRAGSQCPGHGPWSCCCTRFWIASTHGWTKDVERCWPCRWLYANMSAQLGIQSGLMMASFVTKSLTPSCMSNSVSKAK